jgi:hypothetical protein
MGLMHSKNLLLNSEFSDMIRLFNTVILILSIPKALLISDTLYSFFCRIDRRMCVIDYIHSSTVLTTCNLNYTSDSMVNTI